MLETSIKTMGEYRTLAITATQMINKVLSQVTYFQNSVEVCFLANQMYSVIIVKL